jgi:hypothetical protein
MREGVGWPRRHRGKRGEPERRPATGGRGGRNDRKGIVRQPQFGQSSDRRDSAGASDEEGKKMKDFHSPSPTPVECVNLLPGGAGPARGGEPPRSDPNRGFPRKPAGPSAGGGRREWMAREMLVRGTLAAICTRSVRS